MAAEHLVAGSPLDLRPYFVSLHERPACAAFLAPRLAEALRDIPARRVLDVGGSSGA